MSNEQVAALPADQKRRIVDAIQKLSKVPGWTLKIDSRLWLFSDKESTLSRVYPEWGTTMGIPESQGADLIPELVDNTTCCQEQQQRVPWEFIEKKHYSSFVDSHLQARLQQEEITDVYLVGINTDYCIFNTAMDSFARVKLNTFVVEEGVGSIAGTKGHEEGLTWIRAHLGPQAVVPLQRVLATISSKCCS